MNWAVSKRAEFIVGMLFSMVLGALIISPFLVLAQIVWQPDVVTERFATSTLSGAEIEKVLLEEMKMNELIQAVDRNSTILVKILQKI